MNILITGSYGFIGTYLSRELVTNNVLIAMDIKKVENAFYSIYYSWDELDNILWSDIDIIIHLAGKAHDTKDQSSTNEYFTINTELTKKIFDYFLRSGAQKFIYFSSVKAVADKVDGILTEDVIPSPHGPYGESKLEAEQYLLSALKRYEDTKGLRDLETKRLRDEETLDKEISNQPGTRHPEFFSPKRDNRNEKPETKNDKLLYILRPCMIHGPGNKGNLNSLVKMVKKGIPYPLGAFENKRSFTSIDNLIFILRQLIEKDIPSGIYNVADDIPVSTNDLVRLISDSSGKPARIWKTNKSLLNSIAGIGSLLHLPFNRDSLQKLTESYVVSNSKIKEALNISKFPVDSIDGLNKSIQSLLHTN